MNRVTVIPHGMKRKPFYCHICGEKLIAYPHTRVLERTDPDYKKARRMGNVSLIGKIELTEYDFKCLSCEKFISYDEQCVIAKIQKRVEKPLLTQADVAEHEEGVRAELARKRKIKTIIGRIVYAILIALFIYYCIKTGSITIEL